MSSSRSSSAEASHRRKHLPKSLGGNNTPYIAALRGSPIASSPAYFAYQPFQEPLAAISISAAKPLNNGPDTTIHPSGFRSRRFHEPPLRHIDLSSFSRISRPGRAEWRVQNTGSGSGPAKVAKAAKPRSAPRRPACHHDAPAPHFADQAFDKLFTASRIPGS
jgi:hypothetical protein